MRLAAEEFQFIKKTLGDPEIIQKAFKLGRLMWNDPQQPDSQGLSSSQVNGFHSHVCAALAFSEVLAFIKRKVGLKRWSVPLGMEALSQLNKLQRLALDQRTDALRQQQILLNLVRGWVQLVSAEYHFSAVTENYSFDSVEQGS